MGDLTDEERELLAATPATAPRRGRPARRGEENAEPEPLADPVPTPRPMTVPHPAQEPVAQVPARESGQRGPHSPVQFDDDGWSNVPVQMRG